jgi:predicted Zn-dependent protease
VRLARARARRGLVALAELLADRAARAAHEPPEARADGRERQQRHEHGRVEQRLAHALVREQAAHRARLRGRGQRQRERRGDRRDAGASHR